jgi:hypothetical protein
MTDACNLEMLSLGNQDGTGCPIKLPPEGHVLTPWVKVKFQVSGVSVTVGNESSPENDNHAVIKDFELGFSQGVTCRLTIVDEAGSSFVKFMEDILKDFKCQVPNKNTNMHIDFGWAAAFCSGGTNLYKNPKTIMICAMSIEANFNGGKFLFVIEGRDIAERIIGDHREDKIYDKNLPLTQAITKMLTDGPPSVSSVKFLRFTDDGKNTEPIKWKITQDTKGPTAGAQGWIANSDNRLTTALRWLKNYPTDRDKGVSPIYNSTVDGGEIIFWEDPNPTCDQFRDFDSSCIGTYVVNGGRTSPVLEFSPKIRWDFMSLSSSGGGTGSGKPLATQDGGKTKGRSDCTTLSRASIKGAGGTQTVTVPNDSKDNNGSEAAEKAIEGQDKQLRATYKFTFTAPVEAELLLVGDAVTYDPVYAVQGKTLKIIVLNPSYVMDGSSGCYEWLAPPMCNEVLSNKGWFIKSVNHRISEGKFTTNVKVALAAPGVDLDVGAPLGGPGSGGWTPPAAC